MPKRRFTAIELASTYNDPTYFGMPMYGGRARLSSRDRLLVEKGGTGYNSLELYLDLLTDPQVYFAFDKQVAEIISREWVLEPGGQSEEDIKAFEFTQDILANLSYTSDDSHQGLTLINNSQGMDGIERGLAIALLTGISLAEIIWDKNPEGRPYPKEIKIRDPRRFLIELGPDHNTYLKLLTKTKMWDGIYVPAKKFIVFRYWAIPNDDPYGSGVGRFLYYPVQWKREAMSLWLSIIDKHADPTALGTYPIDADSEQIKDFEAAIGNIARDMSICMPEGFKVTFQNVQLSSAELLTLISDKCDAAISKVVMGEAITGEQASSGSYARETASNSLRVVKAKALSDLISECLNNTLIKWICYYNFPNAKPPKYSRNFKDLQELIQVLLQLKQLGFYPDQNWVESMFSIPMAEKATPKAPSFLSQI